MKEIIIGYNEHKPGEPDPLWTAWEQTGEIVRCKDCKHYVGNGADASKLPYWYPCKNMKREDEWFCADGERKKPE